MTDKEFFENFHKLQKSMNDDASYLKEYVNKQEQKSDRVFCSCVGDIDYEGAMKRRYPYLPQMHEQLDMIEAADPKGELKFDRNKGYCHNDVFFLAWLTNGHPIIVFKDVDRSGRCDIHYADDPSIFPTPEDLKEEWPDELPEFQPFVRSDNPIFRA